jgi:hypothetical protein
MAKSYVRKGGWGGFRPGAGRKPQPKPTLPVLTKPNGNGHENGNAVLRALRQLADGDVDLRHRLDRLERAMLYLTNQPRMLG